MYIGFLFSELSPLTLHLTNKLRYFNLRPTKKMCVCIHIMDYENNYTPIHISYM